MQPNCPSGEERGETVTDRRQRWGITRPAQEPTERRGAEGWGDRCLRPQAQLAWGEGLGLDGEGGRRPRNREETVSL